MTTQKKKQSQNNGVTIHPISLDKECWESVPKRLYDLVNTNLTGIKTWTAIQENEREKECQRREELESRLKETDKHVEQLQQQLKFLFAYTNSVFARQHKQTNALSECLRRDLGMTKSFFTSFCQQFGVPVQKSNAQSAPVEANAAESSPEAKEGSTVAKNPQEDLESLCTELEGQLDGLNESFVRWKTWCNEEERRSDYLHSTTEELRLAAERTRERLITWRETLKESAHVVDALSGAVVSTQRDVADLKSTQVTRSAVDEVVKGRALELEEVMRQNSDRIDVLADGLSNHKEEVQNHVDVVQQRMQERIENHGEEVMGALRNNLNPITTYLNSMHVKADAARQELDDLVAQVPQLHNQIEEVQASHRKAESDSQNQIEDVYSRLDQVTEDLHSHGQVLERERQVWSDSIHDSSRDAHERVMEVKKAHKCLQDALDAVQQNRIASLDHGLSTLEQKVAKWVHAQPLPAKISEARLYALESRLIEETNARVRLEAQLQDLPVLVRSKIDGDGNTQSWASLHGGTVATMSAGSLTSVNQSQMSPKLPPVQSAAPPAASPRRDFPSARRSQTTRKIAPANNNTPELLVQDKRKSDPGSIVVAT